MAQTNSRYLELDEQVNNTSYDHETGETKDTSTYDSIKKRMPSGKTIVKMYITYLLMAGLLAFDFYLDYRCQGRMTHIERIIQRIHPAEEFEELSMLENRNPDDECMNNHDCNNGICITDDDDYDYAYCECNNGWITYEEPTKKRENRIEQYMYNSIDIRDLKEGEDEICNYKQIPQITAFIISLLTGSCGIDRCFLARGNGCWVCLGVLKGCTFGGCTIWWIIDWVFILTFQLNDGNGQPLKPFPSFE